MKNNYTVYMHICPNNKKYIGITGQNPQKRWANGKGYIDNALFYKDIQKYGWDNIEHEILLDGLNENQAWKIEEKFITAYKTKQPKYGYNRCGGIFDTHKPTVADIENISKATRKKVIQLVQHIDYDLHKYTYEIIEEYSSIIEAAKAMGAINSGNISKALRSNNNYAYGYYWKYSV